MTKQQFRDGECNETAGFLFPHPCVRMSTRKCGTCQKPICEQHLARGVGDGSLCITCAKKLNESRPRPHTDEHWDDDDPYFYSDTYYESYYWGRDDFTESDESVLTSSREPQDLSNFENNMGAS